MLETFRRSWEITKLTFGVIKQDRELLLFPLLAGIFSLLFTLAMILPTIVASVLSGTPVDSFGALEYAMLFLVYLGLAFIATFFNVCVVYTAKRRFAGGDAAFMESIRFATSKVHLIFAWSMVAATVGILLRMLDKIAARMQGPAQYIINALTAMLGIAWSIITIFVVPGMVYHDLGPLEAIKRSVATLRKTWGESLVRYLGLGLMQFLFLLGGILAAVLLVLLVLPLGILALIVVGVLAFIYLLAVILVFSVANTVFNTALYEYADTGKVPKAYNKELLRNAFKQRKPRTNI